MVWHYQTFGQLNTTALYGLLQLRARVFVVEQNCPYQDLDDKDLQAVHVWCTNDAGHITACCRVLPAGLSYTECSIGRVATDPAIRGDGTGRLLMEKALEYIRHAWNSPPVRISAQHYLQRFYESFGFVCVSEVYQEDDIPHIEMLLQH